MHGSHEHRHLSEIIELIDNADITDSARKISKEGRAIQTDTENDITIEVKASVLPSSIRNQLPANAESIRLTSQLKKDNFFTKKGGSYYSKSF